MSVPKLRFKEFDGDWSEQVLSDISDKPQYGMNLASTEFDGENKYLRITDINEETHLFDKQKLTSPDGNLEDKYLLKKGDLLFARTGASVGKSYLYNELDGKVYFAGFLIKFSLKNTVNPYFIFSQTLSKSFENWVTTNSMRSGQPGINAEEYSKLAISVPSKEEQTKIASFLSAVDEKINQLSQKHSLLSQYKQGMMQKLFSQQIRFKADDGSDFGDWEDKKLGDICSHFQSGKTITSATITDNGEYPVFGGNGLRGYTNTYTHDGIFALIGRQGALCGNVNLVMGKNFISEHAIAVQTKDYNSTEWLSRWLDFMQLNRFSESSAQAGLAVNKLVKFDIKVPCLEEQTKIANFLSAIDQKIEVVAQQIEQAKQWKKGLLQQMFV